MSQQSVRQEARRSALDAQEARRQRPHHHGRCLAVGRQPRASHRRPCPSTRPVTTTSEPGPGRGSRRAASLLSVAVSAILAACSGSSAHPPARPDRRPLSSRRRDGIPAVPGCRFAERRPLSRISDVAVRWGTVATVPVCRRRSIPDMVRRRWFGSLRWRSRPSRTTRYWSRFMPRR
jgi:hypothetical protein